MSASVVIPCRDAAYLGATLESLAGQVEAPPFEVIVVDGSASKRLSQRLVAWKDRLDIRVVEARVPGTPGGNRNIGSAASDRDLLLFVDADDTVDERYVAAMIEALRTRPFVCGRIDLAEHNAPHLWASHPQMDGLISTDMRFLPFASAGTLGIRRTLFEEIGRFDSSLRRYAEADLCWRMQLAGMPPPTFVQGAISHHRLDRRTTKRFRKALLYGVTEAFLYRRYRHVGMPRESAAEVVAAWGLLLRRLFWRVSGKAATGVGFDTGHRLGRLIGSVRHRVAYL